MNTVDQLLSTTNKERSRKLDPEDAFRMMFSQTMMASDLLERWGVTHASELDRDKTAKLAKLLTGASTAATALDAHRKLNP